MESAKPSQAGIAFKWAVFNLIGSIIITVVIQVLGKNPLGMLKLINYIPLILFMCMTQIELRKELSGFINYGDTFVEGLLFSVFAGMFGAIFMFLYLQFINPAAFQQYLRDLHDTFVALKMPDSQIDSQMNIQDKYGVLMQTGGALIGTPIVGAIICLITSAFIKKQPTLHDLENQSATPEA